jgi:hypothetical protein
VRLRPAYGRNLHGSSDVTDPKSQHRADERRARGEYDDPRDDNHRSGKTRRAMVCGLVADLRLGMAGPRNGPIRVTAPLAHGIARRCFVVSDLFPSRLHQVVDHYDQRDSCRHLHPDGQCYFGHSDTECHGHARGAVSWKLRACGSKHEEPLVLRRRAPARHASFPWLEVEARDLHCIRRWKVRRFEQGWTGGGMPQRG